MIQREKRQYSTRGHNKNFAELEAGTATWQVWTPRAFEPIGKYWVTVRMV